MESKLKFLSSFKETLEAIQDEIVHLEAPADVVVDVAGQTLILQALYNAVGDAVDVYAAAKFHGWDWLLNKSKFPGTLPKRIANVYYKLYKVKLSPDTISKIGEIAKRYTPKEELIVLDIDFTKDINWHAGAFGDWGSCFWGGRDTAKKLISENGFAMRLWHADKNTAMNLACNYNGSSSAMRYYRDFIAAGDNHKANMYGYSRCWVAPDLPVTGVAMLFNSYPGNVSLITQARALALLFGLTYRQMGMSHTSDVMYINNSIGYAVGPADLLEQIRTSSERITIRWSPVYRYTCSMCGDTLEYENYQNEWFVDGHTYTHLCDKCVPHDQCNWCNDYTFSPTSVTMIDDIYTNMETGTWRRLRLNNPTIDGLVNAGYSLYHNVVDAKMCPACYQRVTVSRCRVCGERLRYSNNVFPYHMPQGDNPEMMLPSLATQHASEVTRGPICLGCAAELLGVTLNENKQDRFPQPEVTRYEPIQILNGYVVGSPEFQNWITELEYKRMVKVAKAAKPKTTKPKTRQGTVEDLLSRETIAKLETKTEWLILEHDADHPVEYIFEEPEAQDDDQA